MEEIWKDIEGYEGSYQVSNLGRVKSLERIVAFKDGRKIRFKEKIISLNKLKHGYLAANLWKDDKRKSFKVHRLVAKAFIARIDGKDYVDHINGIPSDCRVCNLRWCTHKENMNFPLAKAKREKYNKNHRGINNPRYGKKRPKEVVDKLIATHAIRSSKPVRQFTKEGEFVKDWSAASTAARELGARGGRIHECCKGVLKSHHGFVWKYID